MSKSLQSTLEVLLSRFGKSNYKSYSIDQIKMQIGDALDDTSTKSPAEKAMIIRLKSKINKMKDVESILTELTEKMFSLDTDI